MASSLEQQREENIARNEQFLKKIGLLDNVMQIGSSDAAKRERKKQSISRSVVSLAEFPTRKSRRIAEMPIEYKNSSIIDDYSLIEEKISSDGNGNCRKSIKKDVGFNQALPYKPLLPPTKELAKNINANVGYFYDTCKLGHNVDEYGKAAIMSLANNGSCPSFSKYSGVVQWKNCIFLWVNIGYDKSKYPNTFIDDGSSITWFGGSKMTADSPVVGRLVAAGNYTNKKLDVDATLVYDASSYEQKTLNSYVDEKSRKDRIILFCRLDKESYCCLGRVSLLRYDLTQYPVYFEWKLLDHGSIYKKANDFKRILSVHGIE